MSLVTFCLAQESAIENKLLITDAVRELDMTTQVVKETTKFSLENSGTGSVEYFLFSLPKEAATHLAYLEASKGNKGEEKLKSGKTSVKGGSGDVSFYKVELGKPLGAGDKTTVTLSAVFTHSLSPYPTHISQAEQQYVVYEGNLYVLSPYAVKTQKTVVKLGPGTVNSFTKDKQPVKNDGGTLTYGPYENVAPFAEHGLRLHFENNSPFLTVDKLTRLIEVSHWGNIAVEEYVEMTHSGAKLKGSFSRFDFQRDRRDKMPAVQNFKTVLPASARDVYYRDEIGNISTSHMRVMDEAVELEIRPRFPLFGGWKTNYYIGYNVPSYEYLMASGNNFVLKMRFVDHILDNLVIDEATVKVILPENTKNIRLVPPFKVKRGDDQLHHTYLDYSGRPVVVAHKSNLVEAHIQEFELHYTFDRVSLVQEPLMVIVAFFLMFLVVIVYVRLDFAISKDAVNESRMKVAGLVEEAASIHARRSAAYDLWSEAITKYKASKDPANLTAQRKKVEADLRGLHTALGDIQVQLKAESPETAEKVGEIQRLDKAVKDQLTTWQTQTEKLIGGKVQKGAYADAEKTLKQKMEEARDKMDNLTYTL